MVVSARNKGRNQKIMPTFIFFGYNLPKKKVLMDKYTMSTNILEANSLYV